MRKILIAIAALIIIIAAFIAGHCIGKNHVIFTQEIYAEGGEYIAVIDGEAHSYS